MRLRVHSRKHRFRRSLLRRANGFIGFGRFGRLDGFVVFTDFVHDFQLRAVLLITTETNVVAVLHDRLSLIAGEHDERITRKQVLSFVDRDPVVIDQRARADDGKVTRNFSRDLLEPQHTIQLAIDPDTTPRTNDCPCPGADQRQRRELSFDRVLVNYRTPVANKIGIDDLELRPLFRPEQVRD